MISIRGRSRLGVVAAAVSVCIAIATAMPPVAGAAAIPAGPLNGRQLTSETPSAYAAAVLADGPLAYYRLGEASGTSAANAAGPEYPGTYVNGPSLGVPGALAGDPDTALGLNAASDQYLQIAGNTYPLGDAFSYELWVKPDAALLGTWQVLFQQTGTAWETSPAIALDDTLPGHVVVYERDWSGSLESAHALSADTWHHVVWTHEDGTDRLWVDGVDDSGTAQGSMSFTDPGAGDAYWGIATALTDPFAGALDELAVYDHALSAAQVAAHYAAGSGTTPPPPPSPSAYATAVLADSPVVYWRLGESAGTSAADASGNGHAGTLSGSASFGAPGLLTDDPDTALALTSAALSTPDAASLDTGAFSFEARVQRTRTGAVQENLLARDNVTLDIGGTEPDTVECYFADADRTLESSVTLTSTTTPYHIVCTYAAGVGHVYVNGSDVTRILTPAPDSVTLQGPLTAGGGGPGVSFAGTLDEVAVYDHALTPAQVAAHYTTGSGQTPPVPSAYAAAVLADGPLAYYRLGEASGTSAANAAGPEYPGTYVNGPSLGVPGALAGDPDTALGLNAASDQYLQIAGNTYPLGDAFSYELWVKPDAALLGTWQVLFQQTGTAWETSPAIALDDTLPGHVVVYERDWSGSLESAHALSADTWHHVVWTHEGTSDHLWIDGVDDSGTAQGSMSFTDPGAGDAYWGIATALTDPVAGALDELAVYDHALSAAQVAAHDAAGTGSGGPLAVALTSPTPEATLFATEALTATVSGGQAPYEVDFLVDGTTVGSADAAPYTYAWDATGVADGDHVVTATVHDAASGEAASAAVPVSVANALPADERVDHDYAAGLIDVNAYALDGVYALGAPAMLSARYQASTPASEGTTEVSKYLGMWSEIDQSTRDQIATFLGQPLRGAMYGATLQTAAPTGQSAASMLASLDQPPPEAAGVTDPCEWMVRPHPYSDGYLCIHTTSHFSITYVLAGTGVFANEITAPDDRWGDDPTAQDCPDPLPGLGCNGVPDYVDEVAWGLGRRLGRLRERCTRGLGLPYRRRLAVPHPGADRRRGRRSGSPHDRCRRDDRDRTQPERPADRR